MNDTPGADVMAAIASGDPAATESALRALRALVAAELPWATALVAELDRHLATDTEPELESELDLFHWQDAQRVEWEEVTDDT